MTGQPATVIARWPSANPQSAIPLLGRALTVSRPGTSLGRRAIQIKPFRMPGTANTQGRNMYVVREHDGANDKVAVFVEDPNAPLASERSQSKDKGKGKAKAQEDDDDDDDDDDDVLFVDPDEKKQDLTADQGPQHSRWTYCSIAQPLNAPGGDTASAASLFETFIQRALFPPPTPGGGAGGAQSGNSANSREGSNANAQYWQPRAQVISIEGFVFALSSGAGGGSAGGGGNQAGVSPDWIIKVGSVGLKGGSASGLTKGCVIEATYLPVPYLPAGSTFARDFVLSLFPSAAVRNGEIELVEPSETDFFEAGMLDLPDPDKGEELGEWEWQGKHTLFTYVHQFKKEGIL
ncbi:hypothetical protein JCM10908_004060 [Rhodotorula pacifica]|uniref:uncharacterized protein n=1 Tax=Rhodotorula pacifica TaxID=1495444 RepID=UPI003170F36E